MKQLYRINLKTGEWVADFACLETAQRFIGSDESFDISPVFKLINRKH